MQARLHLACLAAAGSMVFAAAVGAAPIRVAVLPVVVHAATADTDYLSAGLAEMLSSRLEQAGGIEVVSLPDDARSTNDLVSASKMAQAADAEFVVYGSFTQFGEGASFDVRCARVLEDEAASDANARRAFVQAGRLGEIIPRLDDLTARMVQYIKGGSEPTASGGVAGESSGGPDTSELERRLENLERAVFSNKEPKERAPGGAAPE